MNFDDIIGREFLFYGIDKYMFKLDDYIWEVLDSYDGYHSYLETVELRSNRDKKLYKYFFREPLAIVTVVKDDLIGKGYAIADCEVDHTWLRFGTDETESYYPYFYFKYTPREEIVIKRCKVFVYISDPFDNLFEQREA